jgi:hypothetical protein
MQSTASDLFIDDFKQMVCNSALKNGRPSHYSSTSRKLEKIFDQRITKALSAPYIDDTELAAPILPEAKEYSLGIKTAEDCEYELELSNSPWRRYRTPEPEADSLQSSDEHTDEENQRREAYHGFRLRAMSRNPSGQFESSSAKKRSSRSSMGKNLNTNKTSLTQRARTANQTEQRNTRRKQLPVGKNIAIHRAPTPERVPRELGFPQATGLTQVSEGSSYVCR